MAFGATAGLSIGLTEFLLRFAYPDADTLPLRSNKDVAQDFAKIIQANIEAKREVERELDELEKSGELHRATLYRAHKEN